MDSLSEKVALIRKRLLNEALNRNKSTEHITLPIGQPNTTTIATQTSVNSKQITEAGWLPETENLINWFLEEAHLPKAPFELYKGVMVTNEVKFYESLRHEIKMGPKGYRAKNGVLQEDLKQIKRLKDEYKKRGNGQ